MNHYRCPACGRSLYTYDEPEECIDCDYVGPLIGPLELIDSAEKYKRTKYVLELDFGTEKHCLICPLRDKETNNCKMQYKDFLSWAEQMTNCPLKLVKKKEDCPLKLEKQVPQKVKKYKGLNETACPNCRFVFGDYEYDDEKFDYCYNCGQRLSWESEVEQDE